VIKNLSAEFSIRDLCSLLQVSRSAYYKWHLGTESPRTEANRNLLEQIRCVHEESRLTYGSPRVTQQLLRNKVPCSENRVARLMRRHGLRARHKKPFRPRTTQSHHGEPLAPNRLKELVRPARPNQAWVADITYVWTVAGWVYLAAVMDLYSRKIVGWSIGPSLETSLVKEALQRGLADRRPAAGLLHHSDRGIQYASSAFRALLHSWKITPSMSAQGNCYDNAAMEAFWSTLKTEMIHQTSFQNLAQARLAVFDYIETFYNRRRLHSALGFKSPVEYEQQLTHKNN
jgi:transposase InsO family protein